MQTIEINLLQVSPKEAKPGRVIPIFLVLLNVVLIAAIGWSYVNAKQNIRLEAARIESTDQRIAELQSELETYLSIGSTAAYLEMPSMIRANFINPSQVLAALTPLLPERANLSSLTFSAENGVKVTGLFASTEDVVTFMQEIKQSPNFRYVSTGGMTKVEIPSEVDGEIYQPVIQVTFDLVAVSDAEQGADTEWNA